MSAYRPVDDADLRGAPPGDRLAGAIDGRLRLVGGLVAIGNRPAWKARCGIDALACRLRKHGFTG
ncbi:hypothetical protein [Nonomuraea sp. SYSU D8015]|uniref:hypothetical protein n=1 Tax=Nonomuraea sp. SYSU D8015 TaxID=2593644 RepID=UPI0016606705|nr:hypothetical protein [Nonomuraea sp. SYSU D8015]